MVLVTGGTGFVGRALLRRLVADDQPVSLLIRPTRQAPALPPGRYRTITGTLEDLPALHTALEGVETVIHLAGARRKEGASTLQSVNHQGTVNLVEAATLAGVRRFVYLSHMHADRNSAYPLLRSKGAAEEAIRSSGLAYTILRSSLVFGPGDSFTCILAMLIKVIPIFFPVTGVGKTRFQPLHVDDLAFCLAGCSDIPILENATLPIGGSEHLSYNEILDAVMEAMGVRRARIYIRLPLMRPLVRVFGLPFPNPPLSNEQLDLFSVDNTTDLGNVPRNFNLEPRRFTRNLGYLRRRGWRRAFLRYAFQRRG